MSKTEKEFMAKIRDEDPIYTAYKPEYVKIETIGFEFILIEHKDKKTGMQAVQMTINDRLATYIETVGLDKILKAIDKII